MTTGTALSTPVTAATRATRPSSRPALDGVVTITAARSPMSMVDFTEATTASPTALTPVMVADADAATTAIAT